MSADSKHSPDRIWVGTVVGATIGLLLGVMMTLSGVAGLFYWLLSPRGLNRNLPAQDMQSQSPGVEPHQAYHRQRILAQELVTLKQYAWQDPDQQYARIPLKRSIEIMAEQDLRVTWPSEGESP